MDSNDRDPLDEALIALREAIERNIDRASRTAAQLDRTLISLSAGALLLSSTFVPIFAPQKLWLLLLFAAWLSFLATMIFVILAMRAEQGYTETAIKRASVSLRQLEDNPTPAREAMKELGLHQPISRKEVTQNTAVGHLNNCALIAFVIGVICLATFAGYNLWRTPTGRSPNEPVKQKVVQR